MDIDRIIFNLQEEDRTFEDTFCQRSREYLEAMGLDSEKGIRSKENGFYMKLFVNREKFTLLKRKYKGEEVIFPICISDPSLNIARGGEDYSFFNIIPEYWHRKIVSFLREQKKPPPGLEELQGIW